ncbi:hypothetical protein Nos7524_1052 [Nostoc sp. PCC 7524]|uniref:hypothetical protein n=1 Tax=Nostoc sp. (strain ATCC 29411 / PCC 7524) TaxID=28072 RepID=UPI00029F32AE|nr:hypothetical protein [Nostoc sp. PCC 7524]AFY46946.1 hypothetical protein Nos7524_1052 [Nostoc sp. PCC 7524]
MEKNSLFTEISAEDAADVSGGGLLTAAAYITVANAFNISPELTQTTALLFLINALAVPGFLSDSFIPSLGRQSTPFRSHRASSGASLFVTQLMYNVEPWL